MLRGQMLDLHLRGGMLVAMSDVTRILSEIESGGSAEISGSCRESEQRGRVESCTRR